jgi:hypothetical protein
MEGCKESEGWITTVIQPLFCAQEADPGQSHKTVFEAVSEVTQELVDLPLTLSQLEARMADPEVTADPDLMAAILDEY